MMLRAFTLLAVSFALLIGAVHAPSVAHESSSAHSHSEASTGGHDHASEPVEKSDEQPDELFQHHHCPNAWCPDAPPQAASVHSERKPVLPSAQHALTSLSQAPPIQPPSA